MNLIKILLISNFDGNFFRIKSAKTIIVKNKAITSFMPTQTFMSKNNYIFLFFNKSSLFFPLLDKD